jgi:pimeloyl-ACP methyl ester carboxylesterase
MKMLALVVATSILLSSVLACGPAGEDPVEIQRSDKLVDIGTHKLRAILSDVATSEYTIVLEAGGGKDSESYKAIQDKLAKLTGTRVMSYDRSGFGQSQLGPAQLDAGDEAAALKKCLESLGIKDKLILVGLSYGGFLAQVFTHQHPDLVSGLVLIDPMNVVFVDSFGLGRLNSVTPYFNEPTEKWQIAGNRMVDAFAESLKLARGKDLPDGIPVILLTSGIAPFDPDIWRGCHEELVAGSENHTMVVAEGNHHDIVDENPDLVLKTIMDLLDRARSHPE